MHHNIYSILAITITLLFPSMSAAEDDTVKDDLGRLFTSPQTRHSLDLNRTKPKTVKQATVTRVKKTKAVNQVADKPLPAPVKMQGYVKRSDGPNTVWINNKPVSENISVDGVKVGRITKKKQQKSVLIKSTKKLQKVDQLTIKISANGKYVKLKAGQEYDPAYNQVKDITDRNSNVQLVTSPNNNHTTTD